MRYIILQWFITRSICLLLIIVHSHSSRDIYISSKKNNLFVDILPSLASVWDENVATARPGAELQIGLPSSSKGHNAYTTCVSLQICKESKGMRSHISIPASLDRMLFTGFEQLTIQCCFVVLEKRVTWWNLTPGNYQLERVVPNIANPVKVHSASFHMPESSVTTFQKLYFLITLKQTYFIYLTFRNANLDSLYPCGWTICRQN